MIEDRKEVKEVIEDLEKSGLDFIAIAERGIILGEQSLFFHRWMFFSSNHKKPFLVWQEDPQAAPLYEFKPSRGKVWEARKVTYTGGRGGLLVKSPDRPKIIHAIDNTSSFFRTMRSLNGQRGITNTGYVLAMSDIDNWGDYEELNPSEYSVVLWEDWEKVREGQLTINAKGEAVKKQKRKKEENPEEGGLIRVSRAAANTSGKKRHEARSLVNAYGSVMNTYFIMDAMNKMAQEGHVRRLSKDLVRADSAMTVFEGGLGCGPGSSIDNLVKKTGAEGTAKKRLKKDLVEFFDKNPGGDMGSKVSFPLLDGTRIDSYCSMFYDKRRKDQEFVLVVTIPYHLLIGALEAGRKTTGGYYLMEPFPTRRLMKTFHKLQDTGEIPSARRFSPIIRGLYDWIAPIIDGGPENRMKKGKTAEISLDIANIFGSLYARGLAGKRSLRREALDKLEECMKVIKETGGMGGGTISDYRIDRQVGALTIRSFKDHEIATQLQLEYKTESPIVIDYIRDYHGENKEITQQKE